VRDRECDHLGGVLVKECRLLLWSEPAGLLPREIVPMESPRGPEPHKPTRRIAARGPHCGLRALPDFR
jgi:hypothetical protein